MTRGRCDPGMLLRGYADDDQVLRYNNYSKLEVGSTYHEVKQCGTIECGSKRPSPHVSWNQPCEPVIRHNTADMVSVTKVKLETKN